MVATVYYEAVRPDSQWQRPHGRRRRWRQTHCCLQGRQHHRLTLRLRQSCVCLSLECWRGRGTCRARGTRLGFLSAPTMAAASLKSSQESSECPSCVRLVLGSICTESPLPQTKHSPYTVLVSSSSLILTMLSAFREHPCLISLYE